MFCSLFVDDKNKRTNLHTIYYLNDLLCELELFDHPPLHILSIYFYLFYLRSCKLQFITKVTFISLLYWG